MGLGSTHQIRRKNPFYSRITPRHQRHPNAQKRNERFSASSDFAAGGFYRRALVSRGLLSRASVAGAFFRGGFRRVALGATDLPFPKMRFDSGYSSAPHSPNRAPGAVGGGNTGTAKEKPSKVDRAVKKRPFCFYGVFCTSDIFGIFNSRCVVKKITTRPQSE